MLVAGRIWVLRILQDGRIIITEICLFYRVNPYRHFPQTPEDLGGIMWMAWLSRGGLGNLLCAGGGINSVGSIEALGHPSL